MHITAKSYDIVVPEPAVFIIQKLMVYQDRKPEYKREKDVIAINELLPYVLKSEIHSERIEIIYDRLTEKEKKKIRTVCDERGIQLF